MSNYLAVFVRASGRSAQKMKLSTITTDIDYRNKDCYLFLINQEWFDHLDDLFKDNTIVFDLDKLKTMMETNEYNNEDFLNLDEYEGILDCTDQDLIVLTDHITATPYTVES